MKGVTAAMLFASFSSFSTAFISKTTPVAFTLSSSTTTRFFSRSAISMMAANPKGKIQTNGMYPSHSKMYFYRSRIWRLDLPYNKTDFPPLFFILYFINNKFFLTWKLVVLMQVALPLN